MEKQSKMVLVSFILFLLSCFTTCKVKLLFLSIEPGGIEKTNITAVSGSVRGVADMSISFVLTCRTLV